VESAAAAEDYPDVNTWMIGGCTKTGFALPLGGGAEGMGLHIWNSRLEVIHLYIHV